MKYLKIGLLMLISFYIGTFPVQALTEEEISDLQDIGDLYGLINYKEELPTETTPYRITMLSPFEKYPSEFYQSYIKISEEEYNNLKSYQEIMNQHQEQYYSIFEPLWDQSIEIQVRIESKNNEYEKLEESLQQETEEERKKQIQEQMDQIEVEVEHLYSERETISLQITEQAKKIDDSVKEAITKIYEFVEQKTQSGVQIETARERTMEISTPGYYLISSINSIDPSEISTYFVQPISFWDSKLIEVPETPKEEVSEEPEIENPSTGIQDIIIGGGMIVICSLTGIYLIRKKKLFVK